MAARVRVRAMEERDLDGILIIQSASPEIAQWTRRDYREACTATAAVFIAESAEPVELDEPAPDSLMGFLVARVVADEAEILNLAVRPDSRHRGAASALLHEALDWAARRGARKAHLEVRSANSAALGFYKRYLFSISGGRLAYYSSPPDDALLLTRELEPAAQDNF